MPSSTRSATPPPRRHGHDDFVDVDKLQDAFGITGVISQRRGTGVVTFAIFKEFSDGNEVKKTSFVPVALWDAYDQMVKLVKDRIAVLTEKNEFPFPIPGSTSAPQNVRP